MRAGTRGTAPDRTEKCGAAQERNETRGAGRIGLREENTAEDNRELCFWQKTGKTMK